MIKVAILIAQFEALTAKEQIMFYEAIGKLKIKR